MPRQRADYSHWGFRRAFAASIAVDSSTRRIPVWLDEAIRCGWNGLRYVVEGDRRLDLFASEHGRLCIMDGDANVRWQRRHCAAIVLLGMRRRMEVDAVCHRVEEWRELAAWSMAKNTQIFVASRHCSHEPEHASRLRRRTEHVELLVE